jgi:hypothetical protein
MTYLDRMEELYATDAYHSLSIEKYTVNPDLIERMKSGKWDTEGSQVNKEQKDAIAARGY